MSQASSSGERSALRGYRWQYDHIASLTYDALLHGDFETLRLTDPDAGRVDDLVLVRRGHTDAYQFKSLEFTRYMTFNSLLKPRRSRSGATAPSLLLSLADGWKSLLTRFADIHVHLVTHQLPSTNDHLGVKDATDRPSPDHFSAFLTHVLNPLYSRVITLREVRSGWQNALSALQQESGLPNPDYTEFLSSLHIDVGAGSGLPKQASIRRSDVIALSQALLRYVSLSHAVVDLDERKLLDLLGWSRRPRLYSRHTFPVDLDTYEPLKPAIDQLQSALTRHNSGYVAVFGPPGSGKSTLLSQALTGSIDRVVRYYAYVPGTAQARSRLTALAFLHDMVVMLNERGIATKDRELPAEDLVGLRSQFAEQLDTAAADFLETQRRTVIIVDGLDHVDRDYSASDSMLAELPRPEELPDGVILIVGSRNLATLNAHAQQQIAERQTAIDLKDHRLTPTSILEICRRAPVTAHLSPDVHSLIVELSDGHPLALGYLINRLHSTEAPSVAFLAAAPAYAGDVAAEYLAVWNDIEDDDDIVEILSVCSRLRVGFTTEWLSEWNPTPTVRKFRRKLLYLFRPAFDGWRFFHDSFRQFAANRTALGDDALPDVRTSADVHLRIADLCGKSNDRKIAAERMFHLSCAGRFEEVLELARQKVFREQYQEMRSPKLIHEDISTALNIAADRADLLAMLRLYFSLVEVNQRTQELENVDMPTLLYEAGLVHEAIAWCGADARRVPLAHAYELAARLGGAGDSSGRRIFDMIEHDRTEDPHRAPVSGSEDDAATAWTRASVLFRPLPYIIQGIRNQVEEPSESERGVTSRRSGRWPRYRLMTQVLIDTVSAKGDKSDLHTIDSALSQQLTQLKDSTYQPAPGPERRDADSARRVAIVIDLSVRLQTVLLEEAADVGAAAVCLRRLLSTLREGPLFVSTMLDAAEVLARHGMLDQADRLLDRTPYSNALTAHALSQAGEPNAITAHFRYWRVRYLLASGDDQMPQSVAPSTETPAGDELAKDAPLHSDVAAIHLAAQINDAVRRLARLDAATVSANPVPLYEIWTAIVAMLSMFRRTHGQTTASLLEVAHNVFTLFAHIVAVARNYGSHLLQRLSDALTHRFQTRPDDWSLQLRLDLADNLRSAGATVPWYRSTLAEWEANLSSESVETRLDDVANIAFRYARHGDQERAQHLVLSLIPMAFGVGYRKDYQFDSWVTWLRKAIADQGGQRYIQDAAWLTRLIVAADPMTEGAPSSAATNLPAAVVRANPLAAVRILEYLVRHGAVDHLDSLAALLCGLLAHTAPYSVATVELAADITAELVAPASKSAYPKLAASLLSAAESLGGPMKAKTLAKSIVSRTDNYALPSARNSWRQALGFEPQSREDEGSRTTGRNHDDFGALELSDGRRIARAEVISHIQSADDLISLRREEISCSRFSWSTLIEQHTLTTDNVKDLADMFDDGSRDSLDALASLSKAAEHSGDREMALRLATQVLRTADGNSWSRLFGGTRQAAAGVAVRLGDPDLRVSVYKNLARELSVNRWLPRTLLEELGDLVDTLRPDLVAGAIWPEIRTYLDGMAQSLELPDPDVLTDHGCCWWLLKPTMDRRAKADQATRATALAEIAVGHLSHPTWLVRDAATVTIVRALSNASKEVAEALGRFAQPGASDDILERAGRCLAAARSHDEYVVPIALQPLERLLANHSSQVIRDLSAGRPSPVKRSLSPLYRLSFPRPMDGLIASNSVLLEPYQELYEILANGIQMELDTLLTIASRYALDALSTLPDEEAIRNIRSSDSHIRHTYPSVKIAASRSAFGRVLADIADAGLLDLAPPHVRRLLRTVDIDALTRTPEGRPRVVPTAPPSEREQTVFVWRAEIENRLNQYITAATHDGHTLIGARSRVAVLNWDQLEEEFVCGTTMGFKHRVETDVFASEASMTLRDLLAASDGVMPENGEPLIIDNVAYRFHQVRADWLSFRPDLAAKLGWSADPQCPGRWLTTHGELAVESIWWVDGWWGHVGPVFDDTAAEGHAVVATRLGLTEITNTLGATTCHFELSRSGRHSGTAVEPVSAIRALPIAVPK